MMKNLLTMNDLSNEEIIQILDQAERFKEGETWE